MCSLRYGGETPPLPNSRLVGRTKNFLIEKNSILNFLYFETKFYSKNVLQAKTSRFIVLHFTYLGHYYKHIS